MAATHAHRITRLETEVSAIRSDLSEMKAMLTAALDPSAKAVTQPKADRKPQPKADRPATKGAQTRETLSRKDWNRTLTAKARRAGKVQGVSVISVVNAHWDFCQEAREVRGWTPDETLAYLTR